MRCFLAFFFCLLCANVYAQLDYKGIVVDSKNESPIPYVNIGIVEAEIGTVSNQEGVFHIRWDKTKFKNDDIIQFSSLGYQTITIPVSKVELVFNDYSVIKMIPTELELEEVVVSAKARYMIPETVGYSNKGEEVFGYWKGNIAIGGELGTKIVVRDGLRRLDTFIFEVWNNPSDSLLLRVNVYDDDGTLGSPKTNLNRSERNILYNLRKDERLVTIDLKPYDIYVKNDFIISLELLEIYGSEEIGLVLAAVKDFSKEQRLFRQQGWTSVYNEGYGTYRKFASQGKWDRITDLNMAYTVESSLLVNEREFNRFNKRKDKTSAKNQFVNGFAIGNGKMMAGVKIFNSRTKSLVLSDNRGHFRIAANKNDVIIFTKKGYEPIRYKVGPKPTLNVILTPL